MHIKRHMVSKLLRAEKLSNYHSRIYCFKNIITHILNMESSNQATFDMTLSWWKWKAVALEAANSLSGNNHITNTNVPLLSGAQAKALETQKGTGSSPLPNNYKQTPTSWKDRLSFSNPYRLPLISTNLITWNRQTKLIRTNKTIWMQWWHY